MTVRPVLLEVQTAAGSRRVLYRSRKGAASLLTEILRRQGLPLNTRCGQRGLCQACQIELISGSLIHSTTGRPLTIQGQAVVVQACQYRPPDAGEVVVRIPPRALLAYEPQVVSDFRINVPQAHDPLWQQTRLENVRWSNPAELAALTAARLDKIRPVRVAPHLAARTGQGITLWVTLCFRGDHWLLTEITEQPAPRPLGVALDVGTTTIAVLLVDLRDGRVLARATDFNRQMHLGDDVVTRITLCKNDPAMVEQLQRAVAAETINPLISSLCAQAGAPETGVVALSIAGNTTMLHLLAGVDPTSLGTAPFTPQFLEHRYIASEKIGLIPPAATAHLLAGAAAYIGADLTAGILASGLLYDDGPSLLVDVGTNGEIILKHGARLLGCATAAGPAFEGARLLSGMRAGEGAISHLRFETEPAFAIRREVIGGGRPVGLCGSAYIDILGQGRRVGLFNAAGRFAAERLSGAGELISSGDGYGRALRIGYAHGKRPLLISESDVASLLQAKAAIAAGITILMRRIGLQAADIRTLYLAGGFGMHVDVPNAIAAGLLPGFVPRQVQVVGNTSLGGAYLSLLEAGVATEVARAAKELEVVELNLDPDFESCYIDQLGLP
jgi:uncharacterized 2Fe-2S/4Fe-4S cluster protein (DUF4445 family)